MIQAGDTVTVAAAERSGDVWRSTHGKDMQTWNVTLEGQAGTNFQINTLASNSLSIGQSGEVKSVTANDEYGDRLQMDWSAGGSGGSSGPSGGGSGHQFQRSKEQCMRGEALLAAAFCAANKEKAFELAADFYAYIEGDAPPAAQGPPLEEVRKNLAAWAQAQSVSMSNVAAAIKQVTGHEKLEAGDNIDSIMAAAKVGADAEIPF